MKRTEIPVGAEFGRWTVLGEGERRRGGHRTIRCVCECGARSDIFLTHLTRGASMGCKDCATVTHGLSKTPAWKSWESMRTRCSNQKHPAYKHYGGRGIAVCERWNDFECFFEDMGSRPKGMTLDRIDGDQGYFKENCKWSTPKEQSNNLSNNRRVVFKGVDYTHAQLAEHLGLNYQTLRSRIDRGSPLDAPLRIISPRRAR